MSKAKENFVKILASDKDFDAMNTACIALLDAITDEHKTIDRTFFEECLKVEYLNRLVKHDAQERAEDAFIPIKEYLEELLYHAAEQTIADEGSFCIRETYDPDEFLILSKKAMKKYCLEVYDGYKDIPTANAYLEFGLKGKLKKVFDDNNCSISLITAEFHGTPGADCLDVKWMSEHLYALQNLTIETVGELDADSLIKLESILNKKHKTW